MYAIYVCMKVEYHSASIAEGQWYVNEISVYIYVRFNCFCAYS